METTTGPTPRARRSRGAFALSVLLLATVTGARGAPFDWREDTPEAEGMSRQVLDRLLADLRAHDTQGLLVVRHDRVVLEWYGTGAGPEIKHGTASLAKAMIGGTSMAVVMGDGLIHPTDRVSTFVPAWQGDPRKAAITFGQLATHSSGLDDAEDGDVPHEKLTGWKGEFWQRGAKGGRDAFTVARDSTPVVGPAGKEVRYSNPGMAMLSCGVTAAIQATPEHDLRALLARRVMEPIGIKPEQWSVGYNETPRVDGLPLVANWGGAAFTARAAARVGRLMLREGDWDGARVLDANAVRACLDPKDGPTTRRPQGGNNPSPGYGWWINRDRAWDGVPRDAAVGAGAGHQLLVVIPSLDLIAVRFGTKLSGDDAYWPSIYEHVLRPLVGCVVDQPYPPSATIRAVRFDPPETIVRKAIDSDNWPMTWGDDDRVYTAYGDGRGFEPFVDRKLSLGLARVEGSPADFRGVNLPAPTAERTGGGAKGPKASGLLIVDGVLHMWVRNTGNATLAWSRDHGATWEWGLKLDQGFGCPTFLNFGRNYGGARDDYVYTYSQDGPGAYEPYDGVALARVPRRRITDRAAYEFFAGLDETGGAKWTPDVTARKPAFAYAGHCERTDAVYAPALKRYLLTVGFGQGKGWGIFDAPEPWGPWTVAFLTRDWGMGDTHGYRLPAKWMSADGRRAWLVFSGRDSKLVRNDAFCVRGLSIDLYPD